MSFAYYALMPVLITGGCGFIGSHLAERLVTLGAKVTILDDLSTGKLENIEQIKDHVRFIQGSITDPETCKQAAQGQQIIFHLAADVSVPASVKHPEKCHHTNVDGIFNLLEAARNAGAKRVVFSSSAAVYGNLEGICSETSPCVPMSPYGFSKQIGELYCQQYAYVFGLETVILRYFNVFGPRQDPHSQYASVIAKFSEAMQHNKPITVFGNGLQTRDFVPVQSIVEANLILGMHKALNAGEIFNVATGKSITILKLIDCLKQQFPNYTGAINFAPERPGDIMHSIADCSKYQTLLQKNPKPTAVHPLSAQDH